MERRHLAGSGGLHAPTRVCCANRGSAASNTLTLHIIPRTRNMHGFLWGPARESVNAVCVRGSAVPPPPYLMSQLPDAMRKEEAGAVGPPSSTSTDVTQFKWPA